MKERPIIMGAESFRAILEGRKTQTRRVVKPRYKQDEYGFNVVSRPATGERWVEKSDEEGENFEDARIIPCPYGKVGDRLWVREAFAVVEYDRGTPSGNLMDPSVFYRAKDPYNAEVSKWKSPMFMPRWASRITLEITDIRVERLRDISEEDAVAEGVEFREPYWMGATHPVKGTPKCMVTAKKAYSTLWNYLNAKRGYPWESNPWVWVVSFKAVQS